MTSAVQWWWLFLCLLGTLNVVAWALAGALLERRGTVQSGAHRSARRLQLLLSAGYVFGCAFRCFMPVYDVPRITLVDSWLSSVLVGRSVATVAELCFVAQWSLLLRELSEAADSSFGRTASSALVPLIAVAEVCSWYSVTTTSNLGHVFEESIWAFCAAWVVISLVIIWPRCSRALRPLLAICCAAGAIYVAYMFLVDVPMYWARWMADEARGRHYMDVAAGLADASQRWVVSHRWQDWKSEVLWMSLYFSAAVWLSISFIHAPELRRHVTTRHDRTGWATA